ncbi:hypothetical protein [Tardibacter chloracetimidivorans]|uniref:hypothetical protein n=1 Tax=Tardibacter chloracetimidivorans TaxID=1921510 RepID=UPI001D05ADF1|nr:hypothetical protein [Tardibacter chloracetimidivorans]
MANMHNPSMAKWESCQGWQVIAGTKLPTPTATQYGSQSYPEDPSRKRPSLNTLLAAKLPTPIASFQMSGQSNPGLKAKGVIYPAMGPLIEISAGRMEPGRFRGDMEGWARAETLPTPTKRDKRMDAWSPAYDKRKSPTMDAVLDGAMTDRAPDKWAYARQIAAMLTEAGLSGASMTLPATYNWMMGFPPGWLGRALESAVQKGLLPLPSSSKRLGMPSSPKSRKRSATRS